MPARLLRLWDTLGEAFQNEGDDDKSSPNKNVVATSLLIWILVMGFCACYCCVICGHILHKSYCENPSASVAPADLESGLAMQHRHKREHPRQEAIDEDSI